MSDVLPVDSTIGISAETSFADPDTCKFTVSRTVHRGGPYFFDNQERAAGSPLVERLFAFGGVVHVLVADNVVTVGKEPNASWSELKSAIGAAIRTQLLTGTPGILELSPAMAGPPVDLSGDVAQQVVQVLEQQINPSIEQLTLRPGTVTDIDTNVLPVLRVTDAALATVLQVRADEDGEESLAFWVEISGSSGNAYTYDIYFQSAADARPEDWSDERGGMAIVVPTDSIEKIRGAVLDVHEGGMVIENPNHPPTPSRASPVMTGPPIDLSGDVAQRVLQVLEQQINPSIAAHGGRADLVAIEDTSAYLRLSGGCAGCGMAAVTLSQGIEVALRESVPEITRVIDVTDHAAGTNPYYEAAKK